MIADAHESVLTTLRRDGRPISLPVWHVVHEGALYVQTPRRSKKVTRVRNDPRGSFVVSAGHAYSELRGIVAEVAISVVDDDELEAQAIAAIGQKYPGLGPPLDELPPPARQAYEDMGVLRLDIVSKPLTWNNAALFRSAE